MDAIHRKLIFGCINAIFAATVITVVLLDFTGMYKWIDVFMSNFIKDPLFWGVLITGILLESEFFQWVRRSKRSGITDLVFILFMFLLMLFLTGDLLTGIMGAFSIYLVIGSFELKEHEVINKVILISAITYNVLFAAGLFDFFYNRIAPGPPIDLMDKMFSLTLWIILILGFVFFGRKYIVVWRFMSPQYITLALYLLSWLLITTIGFLFKIQQIFNWIFPTLLATNIFVYLFTGVFIDKFLGVKPINDYIGEKSTRITKMVENVQERIGLEGRVKVGYGRYPIINAMAYGPFFDKRICIIAPNLELPEDELEAIIAHELGHLKFNHPFKLLMINVIDLLIRWFVGLLPGFYIPATYYDITFGKNFMMFGIELDIIWFIILNLLVFAFLYVFVRIMEAHADAIVKKVGLGEQLAKALYNLESYYALGRQVGVNVVLLADEKLDKKHEIINYIYAARALNNQLYKPSRLTGLTILLNSHPPTFLRIANMLLDDDEVYSAWQETLLPMKLFRKKNVVSFSHKMEEIRGKLDDITRKKFVEKFSKEIHGDLPSFLEMLRLHWNKDNCVGRQVLAIDKLLELVKHVKITGIQYRNSITVPWVYMADRVNDESSSNDPLEMNPDHVDLKLVQNGETYLIKKEKQVTLEEVLDGKKKKDIECNVKIRGEDNRDTIKYSLIKNQLSKEFFKALVGSPIFWNNNEAIEVFECVDFMDAESIKDIILVGKKHGNGETRKFDIVNYRFNTGRLVLVIHSDDRYHQGYFDFLRWCMEQEVLFKLFLKKPVNNDHSCKVSSVDPIGGTIEFEDTFEDRLEAKLDEIDYLLLEHDSISLKGIENESFMQKLAYAIGELRHSIAWIPR
ncbi:M48 family metalloprotease [Candidatus Bathyarchaeota archaeon]|nr:M48 family metalloprotease [Candidatus Bathyarchaeota archaeon]